MKRKKVRVDGPISWLPFDSRLFVPIFSFGHVRGVAKLFLTAEITLAMGVIVGTLGIVILRILS